MLNAEIEIEVRDKNGKLLSKQTVKSKSYLRQYLEMIKGLFACFYGLGGAPWHDNASVREETGVAKSWPYNPTPLTSTAQLCYAGLLMNANVGEGDYGLSVGLSDTVNTIDTWALGSKCAHGVGANQLQYGASTFEGTQNPATTKDWIFRIIRTFTNGSGASITVKEIGLVVKSKDSTGVAFTFLLARDVIPSTVIPNGSTLTVRYIPKITVA